MCPNCAGVKKDDKIELEMLCLHEPNALYASSSFSSLLAVQTVFLLQSPRSSISLLPSIWKKSRWTASMDLAKSAFTAFLLYSTLTPSIWTVPNTCPIPVVYALVVLLKHVSFSVKYSRFSAYSFLNSPIVTSTTSSSVIAAILISSAMLILSMTTSLWWDSCMWFAQFWTL